MRKLTFASLVAGLVVSTSVATTEAQAQTRFGPEIVFANDLEFGIGFKIMTDIDAFSDDEDSMLQQLRGTGDFVYYIDPFGGCDNCSAFEANVNGAIPLEVGEADVYAGAGLNITRTSFDIDDILPGFGFDASATQVGLNVLGGLNFDLGSFGAFAEAGLTLGGAGQFSIRSGIMLGGGGN